MRFVGPWFNGIRDTWWWDTINGTNDRDMIEIGSGNDTVYANGGDDVIWDKDGQYDRTYNESFWQSDDRIFAGSGDDYIYAGSGSDVIDGGSGRDTLDYGYSKSGIVIDLRSGYGNGDANSFSRGDKVSNIEHIIGTLYDDHMIGVGEVTLEGGRGNDRLEGGTGATLLGGDGDDTLVVKGSQTVVSGGDGYDTADFSLMTRGAILRNGVENVIGSRFADTFVFESAVGFLNQVTIDAKADDDTIITGGGNDVILGGDGNDTIDAGYGNNVVRGGNGNDMISGDQGTDRLYGDAGNDELIGNFGTNYLYGGTGDDTLRGGLDKDFVYGGDGNDRLFWRGGADSLTGGTGSDTFILDPYYTTPGRATIEDFTRGQDIIDLSLVDSAPRQAGDQRFVFDGSGGGGPSVVSFKFVGNQTIIKADRGEASAMPYVEIVLEGRQQLSANDFIL